MHCSWFMSLLILLLFSKFEFIMTSFLTTIYNVGLFSINKADDYSNIYHDDDDESPKTPIILNTYTTHPVWERLTEGLGDYPVETTTPSKKSTTAHLSHDDDDVDYFHHIHVDTDDDETDDHTTSTTTKLSSSSSSSSSSKEIKLTTSSSTETTTTESKITVTRSTWLFYGHFTTTTMDLKIVAAYLAKTSEELTLKTL
jgi:hypothetical protein